MKESKTSRGRRAEEIVQSHYEDVGRQLLARNFTIRGGELDIIMSRGDEICFIEVKLVERVEDLYGYITLGKTKAMKRAIQTYLWRFPTTKNQRIDVVFVKESRIVDAFENVEF